MGAAPPAGRDTLGFVGLGQIGRALAGRLLDGGYALTVWNRTRAKSEALAADWPARVTVVDSPTAVAAASEWVVLCLLDDAAARAVVEGPKGLAAGLRPGTRVLNFTTLHPDTSRQLAAVVAGRGAAYLDTTFSGGADAAAAGSLTLMVGGEPDDVAAAGPLLAWCGEPVFHLGPAGAGSLAKILNNALAATCLAASGEALVAARRAGLDAGQFLQVLLASSGRNFMLERTGAAMLQPRRGPVPPTHQLQRFRDYTRIAGEVAAARGLPQQVAGAADSVFQQCIAAGLGEEAFTAFVVGLEPPPAG